MPISNIFEDTFVAFTDISGFKRLMVDRGRAKDVLNKFYDVGYRHLDRDTKNSPTPTVEGIFVSDCGILFVRSNGNSSIDCLKSLLLKIKGINKELLEARVMLTTSIAYGHFHYSERREHDGIAKDGLFGEGYLNAYLDTELKRPKLACGYCRIVRAGLPHEVVEVLDGNNPPEPFNMIQQQGRTHFNYYWMRQRPDQIPEFETTYRDTESLKYEGIRHILAGEVPRIHAA